jgi:hypothetical protein
MKYSLIFTLLLMLNRCYSQNESVTAYYHRAKDVSYMLLLDCDVGYYYSGPHIPIDEVFTYERKGDKIIRHFDTEYSLRQRVDTLIIDKKSLRDINGLSLKEVSPRRRDELIKKYIQPSAGAGYYKIFLERISICKDD